MRTSARFVTAPASWASRCSLSVRVRGAVRTCGCCSRDRLNARAARAVGTLLLTCAMRRRSISMASYDRLFPNQNTMPAGGFGNLIALPLQHARRAEGCTVFLSDDLEPCPDQWIYLAGVRRLAGEQAEQIAAEAESAGGTLGLPERTVMKNPRTPTSVDAHTVERRSSLPDGPGRDSRRRSCRRISATAYGEPLAGFANPEFFERERARLSTHKTPRVIACHEDNGDRLSSRGVVWRGPSSTRSKRRRQRDRP